MYLFLIGTWRLNISKQCFFIYVRSNCNYIISEFGIIEVFIISVDNYLQFQFLKSHSEFIYCQKMEVLEVCFKNTSVLEQIGLIWEYKVNICGFVRVFETCWFFDQTFKTVYVTKIFHRVFVNTFIKISYENEVIIGFSMFVNDTV